MGNNIVKDSISSTVSKSGISSVQASEISVKGDKPKCKACCACPETKKARDACIMENGEENCSQLIEAHKQCMRDMGFNI